MPNDSKALTDLGLEELEINATPALTDYQIIVNPDTKEPELALISNAPESEGRFIIIPNVL